MSLQEKLVLNLRGTVVGGAKPLICLPLVAKRETDLYRQAELLVEMGPDLLEWRVDGYEMVSDIDRTLQVLQNLREIIGDIPLLLTCRVDLEGGMATISSKQRENLIVQAIQSGSVDIVDTELCNDALFIEKISSAAQSKDVKLILSYHNFDETPSEEFIVEKLTEAQTKGADIAKVAVMPNSPTDVLTLLSATNRARLESVKVPLVTISMGELGAVSRFAGGVFGSDITFGVGTESSAPGQIPIEDLRNAMKLVYR